MAPGELIAGYHVPPAEGPQQYAKIGTRNAMVIAVVLARAGPGSRRSGASPPASAPRARPRSAATDAEGFLGAVLEEERLWDDPRPLAAGGPRRFGDLVEMAARPTATSAARPPTAATRSGSWPSGRAGGMGRVAGAA